MKNLILLFSLLLFSLSSFAENEPCDTDHDGIISGSEQYLCKHHEISIKQKEIKQIKSQKQEQNTNEKKATPAITKQPELKTNIAQQKTQVVLPEDQYKKTHPCPDTNKKNTSCQGYMITYITPLACGGQDTADNMQWELTLSDDQLKQKQYEKCQEIANLAIKNHTNAKLTPIAVSPPKTNTTHNSPYNTLTAEQLISKAQQGDTEAQYVLGMMYLNGNTVAKNPRQVYILLSTAAERGHYQAKIELDDFVEKEQRNCERALTFSRSDEDCKNIEKAIQINKAEEDKQRDWDNRHSKGEIAWISFIIFLGCALYIVGHLWILVLAFIESIWWGIFCLFIHPASFIFAIIYWDKAKKPLIMVILGTAIVGSFFSYLMVILAPLLS